MTTWESATKGNAIYAQPTPIGQVDFLFSDGLDFIFSDGSDYVFYEGSHGLVSTVWTLETK